MSIQRTRRLRKLFSESLEERRLLSASSFGRSNTAAVTLSFVPDGTEIIDQTTDLFHSFNSIASSDVWQGAILRAFQTWAVHTNADIGLVNDGGDAFGSAGATQGDPRFGDIRIGSMSMGPGVMALSIPQDVVSGTWVGDVIFNSDANYTSVDDIFAVAVHEAGNVFGLKDSTDPSSPMLSGGTIPTSTSPTLTDLAALDALFGSRQMDRNEEDGDEEDSGDRNDTVDDATRLRTSRGNGFDGSTPTVAYGDVGSQDDVDVVRFDPVDDYEGPMTIEVRTAGISQLRARVRVYDRDGELVASGEAAKGGDNVSVHIPEADESRYYINVDSRDGELSSIGGYAILGVFDSLLQSSSASIDRIAGGSDFRFMEQDQLQDYFVADLNGTSVVVNDDMSADDAPIGAMILETVPGFADGTRYQAFGSYSNSTDIDHFRVTSPDSLAVMTVRVRSVGGQPVWGEISLLAPDGSEVVGTVLVNDGNDLVVQFDSVQRDTNYVVRVSPDASSGVANYELTVSFIESPVEITPIGSGTLTPAATLGLHTLAIPVHQIVHLIASSTSLNNGGQIGVSVKLRGAAGQLLAFDVPIGATRSARSILLPAGNYVVEVQSLISTGSATYSVQSVVVSDPLAGLPDDPTDDPISGGCADLPPELCVPGDATNDGNVNFDDFLVVSGNFGMSNATWSDGDFDGDTTVGFPDFLLLAGNFGSGAAALMGSPVQTVRSAPDETESVFAVDSFEVSDSARPAIELVRASSRRLRTR